MHPVQELPTLLELFSDAALIQKEGRILSVNRPMLSLLGYDSDALLINSSFADLVRPESSGADKIVLWGAHGATGVCSLRIHALPEPGISVVVVRLAEVPMAQILDHNHTSSLNTMANRIVREMRNPLSYVSTNLGFLLEELRELELQGEGPAQARISELTEATKESIQGVDTMRGMLADISRILLNEDGRILIDLREILQEVIRQVAAPLHVQLRIEERYEPVPKLEAAPARVAQLFINILENAVQAIPVGAPGEHKIRIYLKKISESCCIIIEDDGIGLSLDAQQRATEPFYTTRPGATGLGLTVAHAITQSLKGTLTLEPLKQGTRVTVKLPLPHTAPTPHPGARILVVDDQEPIGRSMIRILNEHHVTAATSGRAALELFVEGERFDLIFCDLMMTDMSGPELFRAILTFAPDQARRFVFMSSNLELPEHQSFLAGAANLCIEKPFNLERVRALAYEAIRG